eukprot:354040-Chlamydomonas_euryale.AAC.2
MSAPPNASEEVLKHLFGTLPPKGVGAQPWPSISLAPRLPRAGMLSPWPSISLAPSLPRAGMLSPWPSMTRPGSQRASHGRRSLGSRRARGSSRKSLPRLQEAVDRGTKVTRDAGSAPEREPAAECREEAQTPNVVIVGGGGGVG